MFRPIFFIGLLTTFASSLPLKGRESYENTTLLDPILFQKGVEFAEECILDLIKLNNPNVYGVNRNDNDAYADKLFMKLQYFLKKNYEPLNLGAHNELKWVKVEGLSSIYRSGNLTISGKGIGYTVEVNMGFRYLKGSAAFEKKFWKIFWISGVSEVEVTGIKMFAVINIDIGKTIKPHLESFSVTDWGNMKVSLKGTNWIGKIVQFFSKMFPSVLSNYLKNNLPGMVKDGGNEALDSVDIDIGVLGGR